MRFLKKHLKELSIWVITGLVRLYQVVISPFLPRSCRFYPTCSSYMIQVVHKYGPIKGVKKGLYRISKCHPWSKYSGIDLP